jgi:hypothetical protein
MHEAGKGDGRRPKAISDQQYNQRWDLIFGRDKDEEANGKVNGDNKECVGLEGQDKLHGK